MGPVCMRGWGSLDVHWVIGDAVRGFGEGTPVQIGLLCIVQVKTAYVSCSEFYSMRTLLEGLLDSLTGMCVCAARVCVCVCSIYK